MNPKFPNHPTFDSQFESANLDVVIHVQQEEYDLYMRVDTNTYGHNQWYYFKVTFKEKKTYTFNICNFTKKDSLYQKGMKPFIYSKAKNKRLGTQWEQGGTDIVYGPRKTKYDGALSAITKKPFYTLSF